MAYAAWLTVSLEVELRRLQVELSRSLSRLDALLTEYNHKWERLRYQVRRIRQIQSQITLLEEDLRRARGRPRERRVREQLSDVRASITPYLGRRETIISDINFERDTLLRPLQSRIRYLKEQIRLIEEELERRKRPPPKKRLVHVKIIVYSIVSPRPPKKPYDKRFQAFYNVDAIRDEEIGEIDYSAKLTQKEIDACIEAFFGWWGWLILPQGASEPKWIESGMWEEITNPKGADVKQLSIREDEVEVYSKRFRPPQPIYQPTKKEAEELLQLVQ